MNVNIERVPLSSIAERFSGRAIDIFICSASYEDRSVSAANILAGVTDIRFPLVCQNHRGVPQILANSERLHQLFEGRAARVVLDKSDPLKTADQMQGALSRVTDDSRAQRYVIDVTTFTHEALLILLRILQRQIRPWDQVDLIYTSAAEYSVGLEPEHKWLSKGVLDVRSVLGYPGVIRPSRRSHLIVLVGFESERAAELIESYEPNIVSLGFGDPSTETDKGHAAVNRMTLKAVASKIKHCNEFEFATNDPFAAEEAVMRQVALARDSNVVIAAMNTKLSTIGVAGVAFGNDEIRLCYASPVLYNVEAYSRPGTSSYIVNLPNEFWKKRDRKSNRAVNQ